MRAHLNIGRSTKYMYVFAIVRVSGVYGINSDEFLVVVTDCPGSSNKIEISSFESICRGMNSPSEDCFSDGKTIFIRTFHSLFTILFSDVYLYKQQYCFHLI
jgi:hypothetical protein